MPETSRLGAQTERREGAGEEMRTRLVGCVAGRLVGWGQSAAFCSLLAKSHLGGVCRAQSFVGQDGSPPGLA